MEFQFDINGLLPEEITVVDSKLSPFKNAKTQSARGVEDLKKDLSRVIDEMGMASCKAQGLKRVITNGIKMTGSNHNLYLLKDALANNGKGAVVGMIKVGYKKLFVVDIHNQQLEVNPLCVLDFYVHEMRQRHGYGLRLFKAMLEKENAKPQFLAFDRPSSKFLNFLRKHFDLKNVINQMNNYTIFDMFFHNLSAVGYVPRNRRFVSSAPLDSRLPSVQAERRQISSANSSGRLGAVSSSEFSRYKAGSHANQRAGNRHDISSVLSDLPPRQPGRSSRAPKEASWHRRNASNLSFARSNRSPELSSFSSSSSNEPGNVYSRHTYTQGRLKTNDIIPRTSPLNSPHSISNGPRKFGTFPPVGTAPLLDKKGNPQSGSVHHTVAKHETPSSNHPTLYQQDPKSDLQSINPSTHKSYTINGMYRKNVSLGSSDTGTSWNLFGVGVNPQNTRSVDHNRARLFPS